MTASVSVTTCLGLKAKVGLVDDTVKPRITREVLGAAVRPSLQITWEHIVMRGYLY
ncbi:hypothetical protein M407DRAFT_245022 [Tulasnella calospora MUT 4182]|uniref:Uncharacterized protein n=1 Tax=Tulasnella calospora MUT 4182 TaxID=1051891 RepID=A0A0C3LN94_9AGAM|nr:hypothetical protein M407DRAFT_245022 [Tulasnella calospora MUT 4182]